MTRALSLVLLLAAVTLSLAKPPKAPACGAGTTTKVMLEKPGLEEMYYTVFVPEGVEPGRRNPLIFALHGNGSKSDGYVRNIAKV